MAGEPKPVGLPHLKESGRLRRLWSAGEAPIRSSDAEAQLTSTTLAGPLQRRPRYVRLGSARARPLAELRGRWCPRQSGAPGSAAVGSEQARALSLKRDNLRLLPARRRGGPYRPTGEITWTGEHNSSCRHSERSCIILMFGMAERRSAGNGAEHFWRLRLRSCAIPSRRAHHDDELPLP